MCGYEDADNCEALREDSLFKLAVGRAPESGRNLCCQPTMNRLENAPLRGGLGRMAAALVDIFCRSFPIPPAAITLDVDDTCDAVHEHQQLSLFNAHHDTRCLLSVTSSTMSKTASRWRFSCAPARRRPASGPHHAQASGAAHPAALAAHPAYLSRTGGSHGVMQGQRRRLQLPPRCTRWPTPSAMTSRCAAPRPALSGCAASPASIMPPTHGTANATCRSAGGHDARHRRLLHRHLARRLKTGFLYCAPGAAAPASLGLRADYTAAFNP